MSRIDYVDRSARRKLRKALDGFERTVDVPRLLSVLSHDGLQKEVRYAAVAELRRRYSLAAKQMELPAIFCFEERLVVDPCSFMSETVGAAFASRHKGRCNIWVKLDVVPRNADDEVNLNCVPWLAISLHHGFAKARFRSLDDLAGAGMAKPPVFKEALYGVGGGPTTVWVGANWDQTRGPLVFVPPEHEIYSKVYRTVAVPKSFECKGCTKFDPMSPIQKCEGSGSSGPMMWSELEEAVKRDGCPFFESKERTFVWER